MRYCIALYKLDSFCLKKESPRNSNVYINHGKYVAMSLLSTPADTTPLGE